MKNDMTYREKRDRHFIAVNDGLGDLAPTEEATVSGLLEVRIEEGSPSVWAASILRQIADQLEREDG